MSANCATWRAAPTLHASRFDSVIFIEQLPKILFVPAETKKILGASLLGLVQPSIPNFCEPYSGELKLLERARVAQMLNI
jgi:hypothetical protein